MIDCLEQGADPKSSLIFSQIFHMRLRVLSKNISKKGHGGATFSLSVKE